MKIYKLNNGWEVWYDRSYRIWTAARFNSIGDQLGDCIYGPTKALVQKYIEIEGTN